MRAGNSILTVWAGQNPAGGTTPSPASRRSSAENSSDYVVHERGEGAGTVTAYRLRLGRHQRCHVVAVEEPAPGRQLRERARGSALESTWTLTPGGEGDGALVRLAAELRDPHVSGWLARVWAQRALRRLCGLLLGHLDADMGGARSPARR